MVKKIIFSFLFIIGLVSYGQTKVNGEKTGQVTFITSQNVYVRFDNTDGINKGDTLYTSSKNKLIPIIIVKFISSNSCSGNLIGNVKPNIGDEIKVFNPGSQKRKEQAEVEIPTQSGAETQKTIPANKITKSSGARFAKRMQGRLSIGSYSDISNNRYTTDFQRWNVSLSFSADSLQNSPVSLSSYINFNYRADQWSNVQNNIGNALRIYDLALRYDLSKKTRIILGRNINLNTSSLGAMDGIQFQTTINNFDFGLLFGSRPNYTDYGYDLKLFEYGAYVSRTDSLGSSLMQNSVGVFQQTNNFKTDRRYLYVQHSSNPVESLNFFISSEVDLYKREKGVDKNVFNLTSLFLMTSLTPSSWLSLNASYDARKNVVYYETFKSYADSILESSMRQGLTVRLNLRPFNYVWFAVNYGYRFSKDDPQPSRNYGMNFSFTLLPIISSSFYLNYNKIESGYVSGNYYGASLNKDLFNGEMNLGIGYKKVDYNFPNGGVNILQNIGNVDLSWRIFSSLFLTISYEGTFQDNISYGRIYSSLNLRF